MRRINLRRSTTLMTLGIVTAALMALHIRTQAASHRQGEEQSVHALFDLAGPAGGPFPSDLFTVTDASNNTGLRINLPKPDCAVRFSDCEDLGVINTLDGFNLQPRLSIPFDGSIDVNSVNSQTLFLISLGDTLDARDPGGHVVGINQIVWDASTNTLHVESNELLDQHTRYALIVTNRLRDPEGGPVGASEAFRRFRHDLNFGQTHDPGLKGYRQSLLAALKAARAAGVEETDIVCASVFTTQSVTSVLEKIRDQIKEGTPAPADFNLGSDGMRTVFPLDGVTGMTWNQQTGDNPARFNAVPVNLSFLRIIPGAVGQIAFGKYSSPDYTVHPGEYIPPMGTRTGTPQVQGTAEIYFNLYLPSGPAPAGGWPVAIFGHGGANNKNTGGGPLNVAAGLAAHGVATIAINVAGHGFGPLGTLIVNRSGGGSVTFSAGGRGIDQNGDGVIGAREGISARPPRTIIDDSDGFRQTVADLMQLVRVIEVGVDVDGDSLRDLNASRIYYFGHSLGGMYGTNFLAVEPNVRAGVLNVPGGPRTSRVLNNAGDRPMYGNFLAARTPSLINAPGVTSIEGVTIPGLPRFNENMPLRDGVPLNISLADGTTRMIQSPVVNTVPGAMEIQQFLENTEWVMQPGSPVAYSPYLRKAPLAGVSAKSVIIQFAKGDQTVPNPATTAMLRAGDLADRATFFRTDLAFAENPALPKNPHGFMIGIGMPAYLAIALQSQEQIAVFFASDGTLVIQPQPARFFEVPITSPLPEGLNYIP